MKIKVAELRELATILFDHLEEQGMHEVEIEEDYYWVIKAEELYDPTHDPTELGLGQLTDDWDWLTRVRTGQAEPIAYHLVWLAAFLRLIGGRVVR